MELQIRKRSILHKCPICGRRGGYMFQCSVCKKLCCHNEMAREHSITCMKCFWKEVGYTPKEFRDTVSEEERNKYLDSLPYYDEEGRYHEKGR